MKFQRLSFGIRCKCGVLIPISDSDLDESVPLDELRHKLGPGWVKIFAHPAPVGCGSGGFFRANDLAYFPAASENAVK